MQVVVGAARRSRCFQSVIGVVSRRRPAGPPRSSSLFDGRVRPVFRRSGRLSGGRVPARAVPRRPHVLDLGEHGVRTDVDVVVGRVEVGVEPLLVVGVQGCRQMDVAGRRREVDGEDDVVNV